VDVVTNRLYVAGSAGAALTISSPFTEIYKDDTFFLELTVGHRRYLSGLT
jgi:hypothetical protein